MSEYKKFGNIFFVRKTSQTQTLQKNCTLANVYKHLAQLLLCIDHKRWFWGHHAPRFLFDTTQCGTQGEALRGMTQNTHPEKKLFLDGD